LLVVLVVFGPLFASVVGGAGRGGTNRQTSDGSTTMEHQPHGGPPAYACSAFVIGALVTGTSD
jgi:hypothetical protein